jgi:hypothetical protein
MVLLNHHQYFPLAILPSGNSFQSALYLVPNISKTGPQHNSICSVTMQLKTATAILALWGPIIAAINNTRGTGQLFQRFTSIATILLFTSNQSTLS